MAVLTWALFAPAFAVQARQSDLPRPTFGPQDLHTRVFAPAGWGFTPGTISDPGPEIAVVQGETVSLNLFSNDGIPHRFLVDYDGDNFTSPGEPVSVDFSSPTIPTSFAFIADTVGPFWYKCGNHGWIQKGRFTVGTAPTIVLTNPDGTTQNRWTGGSTHTLTWTLGDPNDPVSSLRIYLNYTFNGGANTGVIANPSMGLPPGATSFDWSVPLVNATDMHVLATAIDPANERGSDDNLVPVVDSAAPTVLSTDPAAGAPQVDPGRWINITFSEPMNRPMTEAAASLCRLPGCTALAVIPSWTGNTLTLRPTSPLARNTGYQGTVSTAARDASDPGNSLAAAHVWTFRTANDAPQIAVTQPTVTSRWTGGTAHDIQWAATDREDAPGALSVWVNYSATGTAPWTAVFTGKGTTTTFSWTLPTDNTNTAAFEFTANDTGAGRTVVDSPSFEVDSTPPTVASTNPGDASSGFPVNANLLVTFSESMNAVSTGTPATVGLREVATSTWVPVAYSWDGPGVQLTVNPTPTLRALTQYRLFVNASARDASDPGFTMGLGITVTFTTGAVPDTTPPAITNVAATPASQVVGGSVALSADVTDDVAVTAVSVDVTQPDATTVNLTMAPGSGNAWSVARTWIQIGSHQFIIWAKDSSGNWGSASGSFAIQAPPDTTPPTIANVVATPGTQDAGGIVEIAADVTDNVAVLSVRVNVTQPDGTSVNATMAKRAGNAFGFSRAWTQLGNHFFRVWAVDSSGNGASAGGFFAIEDRTPPVVIHSPPLSPIAERRPIDIVAMVTDNDRVQEVRIVYTDTAGVEHNETMTLRGTAYGFTIPAQPPGTVRYHIYAVDPSGNQRLTEDYSLTIREGFPVGLVIGLIVLVLVILVAVRIWFGLRRKRAGGSGGSEGPPTGGG